MGFFMSLILDMMYGSNTTTCFRSAISDEDQQLVCMDINITVKTKKAPSEQLEAFI